MEKTLMEYYRKSLEEGPRYEKYTPGNFAEFLIEVQESWGKLRKECYEFLYLDDD